MKSFHGFPAKMAFTPVPNLFLNRLMPQIEDIAELKTTLFIIMSIYAKKGYPRFVSFSELMGNGGLIESLRHSAKPAEESLADALKLAVKRQTILQFKIESGSKTEDIYFLNTPADRQAIEKILNGEIELLGIEAGAAPAIPHDDMPDIFSLYEDNIGMLTPIIAEQLKEAEKLYPQSWIRDAMKKAVNQNKRKWDYISAILERWTAEGKSDGTYRRDSEEEDPDKYIKGKYGHMVRRR